MTPLKLTLPAGNLPERSMRRGPGGHALVFLSGILGHTGPARPAGFAGFAASAEKQAGT